MQGPRDLKFFLASNAGPANENSLLGVPNEVDTGESIGSGEKVNVCKFPLGSVNNWNVSRTSQCSVAMHEKMALAVTLLPYAHRPHHASGGCMRECMMHYLRAHQARTYMVLCAERKHLSKALLQLLPEPVLSVPSEPCELCAAEAIHPVCTRGGAADSGDLRARILHRACSGFPALRALLLPVRSRLQLQLPGYVTGICLAA